MDFDTMRQSLAMRDALVEKIRAVPDPGASVTSRVTKTHARAIAEALMLGAYIDLSTLAECAAEEADDDFEAV